MKVTLFSIFFLVAVAVLYGFYNRSSLFSGHFSTLNAGGSILVAEIARTPKARELGLSGRPPLVDGEAMLFVFDKPGPYSFWMKDMFFPIDIIWLDKNMKVVHIKENANPSSYPEKFIPKSPSHFVLETQAGLVSKQGIKIDDIIKVVE
ncbi:MAG TPA: DUF192 domain-containing protein [Candidatus Paceibacterota bacterium]